MSLGQVRGPGHTGVSEYGPDELFVECCVGLFAVAVKTAGGTRVCFPRSPGCSERSSLFDVVGGSPSIVFLSCLSFSWGKVLVLSKSSLITVIFFYLPCLYFPPYYVHNWYTACLGFWRGVSLEVLRDGWTRML